MENKIIKTQEFNIIIETFEDGSSTMRRTNEGFNPMELLGLMRFVTLEIKDQIKGLIKPNKITRDFIVRK